MFLNIVDMVVEFAKSNNTSDKNLKQVDVNYFFCTCLAIIPYFLY